MAEKRPDVRRVSLTSRRRGRSWKAGRETGAESGVIVQCGRSRIAEATWRAGEVLTSGPGLPVTGAQRARDSASPLRVGCPEHGHHYLDTESLAKHLELVTRGGFRRVDVSTVETAN